jgi:hypothetical protein
MTHKERVLEGARAAFLAISNQYTFIFNEYVEAYETRRKLREIQNTRLQTQKPGVINTLVKPKQGEL